MQVSAVLPWYLYTATLSHIHCSKLAQPFHMDRRCSWVGASLKMNQFYVPIIKFYTLS